MWVVTSGLSWGVDFEADERIELHTESLSKVETQNGTIQKLRKKTSEMVRRKSR